MRCTEARWMPHQLSFAPMAPGEYGNLTSQGVIDPTKVVRNALQDAASITGLLITTEAMVAEHPKKEAAQAPMPGGMGY